MATLIDQNPTLPALLTRAEEAALARRIEAGVVARGVLDASLRWPADASVDELEAIVRDGQDAWQHFLLANVRLVAQAASASSRRSGLDFHEFFQEGMLALAEALQRFDHRRGMKFSTYASPWIRNAVMHHEVSRAGYGHAPVWRQQEARRIQRLRMDFAQTHGRIPTSREVAELCGRDAQWVHLVGSDDRRISLDELQVEIAAPGTVDEAVEQSLAGRPDWLRLLGSQEARVLALRHGLDDGVQREVVEVARILGVSESTVRRIERRGLQGARHLLVDEVAA